MGIELSSVTNQEPPEFLEAAFVEEEQSKAGATGVATPGSSVSANKLLVRGKGPLANTTTPPRRVEITPGLESVILNDDRTRILDTELFPWRMICSLRITAPTGVFVGTGWFAGPRTLFTAGHCVYDKKHMGGWASKIEVRPGRDEDEQPFGVTTATRYATVNRWIQDRDPDFDYGVIHLEEDLGEQTGWFGFASKGEMALTDALVNISGYPADKNFGRQQWHHANRVLRPDLNRIFYDVDTYGGQSGSPVWVYEDDSEIPVVVGIHAYGVGGTPGSLHITANSGPRISEAVFNQLVEWLGEDAPEEES